MGRPEQGKWDKDISGMERMGNGSGMLPEERTGMIPRESWDGGAEGRMRDAKISGMERMGKLGLGTDQKCSSVEKTAMIPKESWAGKAWRIRARKEGCGNLGDEENKEQTSGKAGWGLCPGPAAGAPGHAEPVPPGTDSSFSH